MKIAFCGAHRTGKTELVKQLSELLGLTPLYTNTSSVFKNSGIEASKHYNFYSRLEIQHKILNNILELQESNDLFITDRTSLDVLAYTYSDINNSTGAEYNFMLKIFQKLCLDVLSFDYLFLVQPGIPILKAEGKASLNEYYIEHLNLVFLGLIQANNIKCHIIPRDCTDLESRKAFVVQTINN